MKNILTLFAILLAGVICPVVVVAQAIDVNLIGLRAGKPRAVAAVYLGQRRADVIRILGNPTKVGTQFFELSNRTADVLFYKKSRLYFINDVLTEFDLLDDSLAIGESAGESFGVRYKVANTPHQLAKDAQREKPYFINSNKILAGYKWEKKPGISRNMRYASRYFNYLSDAGNKPAAWIEILFDETGLVLTVAVGQL